MSRILPMTHALQQYSNDNNKSIYSVGTVSSLMLTTL